MESLGTHKNYPKEANGVCHVSYDRPKSSKVDVRAHSTHLGQVGSCVRLV